MLTFPCEATSARTQASRSVKPMSFIWVSCAAYLSSGFPTATGAGGAAGAGEGAALGVDAAGAFEEEAGAGEEEEEGDADCGGTAQGLFDAAAPPPSNAEKSRPPAAGGGAVGCQRDRKCVN